MKTLYLLNDADDDTPEKKAAQKRFHEVYQQRSKFMREESTGYVWLYRRK